MGKKDYYAVLGIAKNVDEAGLKKAYRKLVMQYHPDRHPDDPTAAAKMQEVNEAYETLSDAQKRAEYDKGGSQAQAGQGTGTRKSGGVNFNDFDINDIFGGFGMNFSDFGNVSGSVKKKSANKKSEPERGQSQSRESERESAEREWKEKRDSGNLCKKCNGLGKERVTVSSGFGKVTQTRECSVCHGKGTV